MDDIISYFEPAGVPISAVKFHLQELLNFRLIQPYDPTEQKIYEDLRLKISYSGVIHNDFSLSDDFYLSNMALVTPIRNYDIVSEIREIMKLKLGKTEWINIISKFVRYWIDQDKLFISLPNLPVYDSQSRLRQDLRMKWIISEDMKTIV